jgi:hypothetical protein
MMRKLIFIMVLFIYAVSPAQEPWLYENAYFEGKQVMETYDDGTLILANDEDFYGPSKLFKLDKTGDLLWEHTFEENESTLPLCMAEDSQGNIIVGGRTFRYPANYSNGFLLKLNPCGEMLWFNLLQDDDSYGISVSEMILDKNDNIIIAEYNGDTNGGDYIEDTTLKKYTPDGQLLFSSVLLPDGQSNPQRVIICTDGGYLVEGDFYAPPYYHQDFNVHYIRAALVKIDSLGNVQWRNIYRWEQDTQDTIYISSSTANVVEIASGEFITKAPKREIPNFRPELYKVNAVGETIWSRDISEDDRTYSNSRMVLDKDSNLILGINVAEGNSNYDDDYLEIYKFNQQGAELARWECPVETSVLRDFRWNKDSTSLYVLPGTKLSTLSLYAFKFNTDSMQLDTFATEDYNEYDYYCPEGVVDLNFEFPELSIIEQPEVIKEQLKIAPNPARNFTYLYFDITDYNRSAKLEIYNMQGALMKSYPLQAAIGRVQEDLTTYPKGVYAVSLIVNDRLVESSKMVVE